MILNKCCCCIDLRLGCSIFAIIGILLNAAFFGTIESLCLHPKTILFQKKLGCHPTFYVIALGSSIGILGNLCCLFGAMTSNKILVSIYLLAEGMRLGIYISFGLQNLVIFDNVPCTDLLSIPSVDLFDKVLIESECRLILSNGFFALLSAFVWIYAWICALVLYQKISRQ